MGEIKKGKGGEEGERQRERLQANPASLKNASLRVKVPIPLCLKESPLAVSWIFKFQGLFYLLRSIEVYVAPDLMQVGIIITHKKSITTLVWHHGYGDLTTQGNTAGTLCSAILKPLHPALSVVVACFAAPRCVSHITLASHTMRSWLSLRLVLPVRL